MKKQRKRKRKKKREKGKAGKGRDSGEMREEFGMELVPTKAALPSKRASKDKGRAHDEVGLSVVNIDFSLCRVNSEQECAEEMRDNSATE